MAAPWGGGSNALPWMTVADDVAVSVQRGLVLHATSCAAPPQSLAAHEDLLPTSQPNPPRNLLTSAQTNSAHDDSFFLPCHPTHLCRWWPVSDGVW